MLMICAAIALAGLSAAPDSAAGGDLRPTTVEAFDRYVRAVEAAIESRTSGR